jgi:hypothetical protein
MRVLAAIFGGLLLLPGLCFLGFGVGFTFSGYGMTPFGIAELVIGALVTWGAVALLINSSKPR